MTDPKEYEASCVVPVSSSWMRSITNSVLCCNLREYQGHNMGELLILSFEWKRIGDGSEVSLAVRAIELTPELDGQSICEHVDFNDTLPEELVFEEVE